MGKRRKDALRVNFDRKLELEFHGVKVTSDTNIARRYVIFQMAEVAVPRALFCEILEHIDRLTLAAVTPRTG